MKRRLEEMLGYKPDTIANVDIDDDGPNGDVLAGLTFRDGNSTTVRIAREVWDDANWGE